MQRLPASATGMAVITIFRLIFSSNLMNLRLTQKTDLDPIRKVIETAFSDEEDKVIVNLVADLLSETTTPPIKSLVTEIDGEVVGYVSYSPIFSHRDAGITGYILAPLAVSPYHRKKGLGSKLIDEGKRMLSEDGIDILLVYGDPNYYGRFGFRKETAHSFVPPYPLRYPFGWLGVLLSDIVVGEIPMKFDCVTSLHKPELW
ncbi:N-acetyltransferase [Candidatus Haliotispira prima]|uniref:N-acetyltransferase n=1 Tax=Candidatus Haliotispira prima TaxID=3034016 RepID=A0ABY8MFF7_9SPIO|nr:N-acetyltransferase [Candidatus Haliotispira prima]